MPRGKKTGPEIRSLIIRLSDEDHLTFQQIGDQLKLNKGTIRHIYGQEKDHTKSDNRGRPRKTNKR